MGLLPWIQKRAWIHGATAFLFESLPLLAIPLAFILREVGWAFILASALCSGLGWCVAGRPLAGFTAAMWRFVALLILPAVILFVWVITEDGCGSETCREVVSVVALALIGTTFVGSALWSGVFAARSAIEQSRKHEERPRLPRKAR
jgi:hypothetical protein